MSGFENRVRAILKAWGKCQYELTVFIERESEIDVDLCMYMYLYILQVYLLVLYAERV